MCPILYCTVPYIAACVDASRTVFWDRSKREVLIVNNTHLYNEEMHQLEKGHQGLRENQTPPMEVMSQEVVLELQEEEEVMYQVILVEKKD